MHRGRRPGNGALGVVALAFFDAPDELGSCRFMVTVGRVVDEVLSVDAAVDI